MLPNETSRSGKRAAATLALAAAVVFAAGCAQTPAPLNITETQEAVATVEAINAPKRLVTLRGADGKPMVVQVGPEVRNFAQLKTGDRVTVRFQEALMAEVIKPGTGSTAASSVVVRAAPGERPAAGVAEEVRTFVTIYDVDTVGNVVEVTGPSGFNRRIKVNDPEARRFIRGLKKGDQVEVRFQEAFAISVEPAK
jgi:predicted aconitase with swiveling domain